MVIILGKTYVYIINIIFTYKFQTKKIIYQFTKDKYFLHI